MIKSLNLTLGNHWKINGQNSTKREIRETALCCDWWLYSLCVWSNEGGIYFSKIGFWWLWVTPRWSVVSRMHSRHSSIWIRFWASSAAAQQPKCMRCVVELKQGLQFSKNALSRAFTHTCELYADTYYCQSTFNEDIFHPWIMPCSSCFINRLHQLGTAFLSHLEKN